MTKKNLFFGLLAIAMAASYNGPLYQIMRASDGEPHHSGAVATDNLPTPGKPNV